MALKDSDSDTFSLIDLEIDLKTTTAVENIEDYEEPQEKNGPGVEDGAVQELKKVGKDLQDIHLEVNQGSEEWMQVFKYLYILSVQKIHYKYVCQPFQDGLLDN